MIVTRLTTAIIMKTSVGTELYHLYCCLKATEFTDAKQIPSNPTEGIFVCSVLYHPETAFLLQFCLFLCFGACLSDLARQN